MPIQTNTIRDISSLRLYLPNNLQSIDSRQSAWKSLKVLRSAFMRFNGFAVASFALLNIKEVKKRCKDNLPLIDPIEDMNIKDENLTQLVKVSFCVFQI